MNGLRFSLTVIAWTLGSNQTLEIRLAWEAKEAQVAPSQIQRGAF